MTITAQSGPASTFQWWGGACAASGSQPTCSIPVNDTQVLVTAHFSRLRVWLPTFGPGSINVGSAVPGGAPLVGHPCGGACADYANGERLLFRATPSAGYRMTAWGGDCARARPDHNCALTLTRNTVVSATFERIPPKDCEANQSCDAVGPATKFTVQVTGPGTVTAPRMSMSIPQMTCQSSGTQRSCDMLRLEDKNVSVTAAGVHFLGWGGRCSRATSRTCNFVNKRYSPDPPIIIARFG
jgi:Divergent InlB B-repeat domain